MTVFGADEQSAIVVERFSAATDFAVADVNRDILPMVAQPDSHSSATAGNFPLQIRA